LIRKKINCYFILLLRRRFYILINWNLCDWFLQCGLDLLICKFIRILFIFLDFKKFLYLIRNTFNYIIFKLLLEKLGVLSFFVFVVLKIKNIKENSFRIFKSLTTLLDELKRIIFLTILSDFDNNYRNGQVWSSKKLIDSILEIINHPSHH